MSKSLIEEAVGRDDGALGGTRGERGMYVAIGLLWETLSLRWCLAETPRDSEAAHRFGDKGGVFSKPSPGGGRCEGRLERLTDLFCPITPKSGDAALAALATGSAKEGVE